MTSEEPSHAQAVEQAVASLPQYQRQSFLAELKEERRKKLVKKRAGEWLLGFHWQAFGTLTFAFPVSLETAVRLTKAWLRTAFGQQVYAYVAPEQGPEGSHPHIHTLVGGARRGRHLLTAKLALWEHGDRKLTELKPFRPGEGGTGYVTKTLPEAGSGVIVGRPQKYRPKKRGRGRRGRSG